MEGAEFPFQTLALNCGLSKALAEVVLRAVASAVAAVSHDWNHHLLVILVASKDLLKALAKCEEFAVAYSP